LSINVKHLSVPQHNPAVEISFCSIWTRWVITLSW